MSFYILMTIFLIILYLLLLYLSDLKYKNRICKLYELNIVAFNMHITYNLFVYNINMHLVYF